MAHSLLQLPAIQRERERESERARERERDRGRECVCERERERERPTRIHTQKHEYMQTSTHSQICTRTFTHSVPTYSHNTHTHVSACTHVSASHSHKFLIVESTLTKLHTQSMCAQTHLWCNVRAGSFLSTDHGLQALGQSVKQPHLELWHAHNVCSEITCRIRMHHVHVISRANHHVWAWGLQNASRQAFLTTHTKYKHSNFTMHTVLQNASTYYCAVSGR